MPAPKGSIDKSTIFNGENVLALIVATIAFMLAKKYGRPLLDKATAALPQGK